MPDLTTLRAGDIITAEFKFLRLESDYLVVEFNGECSSALALPKCHVVKAETPPFDWSEVKPGMAFDLREASKGAVDYGIFIGFNVKDGPTAFPVFSAYKKNSNGQSGFLQYHKCDVTRAPEHDIEAQS